MRADQNSLENVMVRFWVQILTVMILVDGDNCFDGWSIL
jgi:hypothetical protein